MFVLSAEISIIFTQTSMTVYQMSLIQANVNIHIQF